MTGSDPLDRSFSQKFLFFIRIPNIPSVFFHDDPQTKFPVMPQKTTRARALGV